MPQIPGVLAVILTLRQLNQFFDEWMNEWAIEASADIMQLR